MSLTWAILCCLVFGLIVDSIMDGERKKLKIEFDKVDEEIEKIKETSRQVEEQCQRIEDTCDLILRKLHD